MSTGWWLLALVALVMRAICGGALVAFVPTWYTWLPPHDSAAAVMPCILTAEMGLPPATLWWPYHL